MSITRWSRTGRPFCTKAIDALWPCQESEQFCKVWDATVSGLAAAGLRVGLATYRGWNDGDRAQANAIWCLVAHLRPATVVETGVAHGLTSRVILEGLHRNGHGHLWSVDLPVIDSTLHHEIGVAVPQGLRSPLDVRGGDEQATATGTDPQAPAGRPLPS